MGKMKWYDITALVLVLVGGINWGFVGFFDYNLVTAIFNSWAKYVFDLVGIAAIFSIYSLVK